MFMYCKLRNLGNIDERNEIFKMNKRGGITFWRYSKIIIVIKCLTSNKSVKIRKVKNVIYLVESKIAHAADDGDVCNYLIGVEDPNERLYR